MIIQSRPSAEARISETKRQLLSALFIPKIQLFSVPFPFFEPLLSPSPFPLPPYDSFPPPGNLPRNKEATVSSTCRIAGLFD